MKWGTVILIKVKSCNALLCVLLVCIHSYLKSVLRYTVLILGTCYPDMYIYVRIHGYFLKTKGVHEQKYLGNTAINEHFTEVCSMNMQDTNNLSILKGRFINDIRRYGECIMWAVLYENASCPVVADINLLFTGLMNSGGAADCTPTTFSTRVNTWLLGSGTM
jgi:hypothetical protein